MVGKTPQVREIVYNVLDDNGDRTVVAKGATTVDVGDTKELFTRTTALESLTSDNVSNISDVQSNITALQNFLGGAVLEAEIENIFSPLLLRLDRDHVSNVTRITTLEDVQLSNSLVISNNYSNISFLQDDLYSNIGRIDVLEVIHESNVANINGNFSNISILQSETANNFSNISTLFGTIESITDFGDITTLQGNVETLKDRINKAIIKIGAGSGQNDPGGTSISLGQSAGQFIGQNSIGIGAAAQTNTDSIQQGNTKRSIVINATGIPLFAPRSETLVIKPIQTDDSNTINIMGYNDTNGEIVQSTLLRGIGGDVHATTNIIVNNNDIVFETNGNGSFGGIVKISSTLDVGGASSFTGAMQMESTLEVGDTSLFVGEMTVHDSVNVHGQSFIVYKGATDKKIILTNEGTGSFLGAMQMASTLHVGGTSSFTGAMQMASTLEVGGTSSFTGDVTLGTGADLIMNVSSFKMKDVGGTETIKITSDGTTAGSASFAGHLDVHTIDCGDNIDVYNIFNMRNSGNVIKATINKDGVSSFAGKMEIANELVVGLNSSFVGGIVVPSTSSFGGAVTVNSTSTFTGDVTLGTGADLIMNVSSFKMKDVGGTETIKITSDGTTAGSASFAGHLDVHTIDCGDNIDVYNIFNMRNSGDINATINKLGVSSFAGAMQIKDTLLVDNTLTVQNSDDSGNGKVIINPSVTNTDCVKIQGGLSIYNGPTLNASITRLGTGFFGEALSTNGTLTARGDFTIKDSTGATNRATISASDGNASFAGTMQVAGTITGGTAGSSFNSGMLVGGTTAATSITTGGKISIGGSSSFTGVMEMASTLTVGGTSSFASGMQVGGTTAVTSIATGGKIIAGGLGSFAGNINGNGNLALNTGSDGTITCGGAITAGGAGSFAGNINGNGNLALDTANGTITCGGAITAGGAITSGGNASFAGTMKVVGTTELNSSLTIKDGGTTKASISTGGNASFAGTLKVVDATELNSSLTIKAGNVVKASISTGGVGSFAGNINGNGNLALDTANGTITCGGAITSGGNASFAGTLKVVDATELNSSLTIKDGGTTKASISTGGNASFAGTLKVVDATELNSSLTIKAGNVVKASISTGGVGSFAGNINGNGNLALDTANGTITCGGAITSGGNASFAGTLKVVDATELNSSLTIKAGNVVKASISTGGVGSFAGNINGNGNLALDTANGTITCGGAITSGGNASFAGTLKVVDATELNSSLTIKAGNVVKASISTSGVSSFAGAMEVDGEIKGDDFIIPSDRRFKTEITHIPNALDKIKQISGCTYKVGDKPSAGVIAQEVLEILPEVVHTREDGYYAVSYHGLIGLLIEAVKELSEKVK